MDNRTILVLHLLIATTLVVLSVVSARLLKREHPRGWILANVLNLLGFGLILTQGTAPPFVSIMVANFLILGSFALAARVSLDQIGVALRRWIVVSVLAIHVGLFAVFTYVQPLVGVRVIVISLEIAFFMGYAAIASGRRGPGADYSKYQIWIFTAFAVVQILRPVLAHLGRVSDTPILGANGSATVAYIAVTLFLLAWNLGVFLNLLRSYYRQLTEQTDLRQRLREELSALETLIPGTEQLFDLEQLFRRVKATLRDRAKLEGMAVYLLDEGHATATLQAAYGIPEEFLDATRVVSTKGTINGRAALEGRMFVIDVEKDYPGSPLKQQLLESGIRAFTTLPLGTIHSPVGSLSIVHRRDVSSIQEETPFLQGLAREIGSAIYSQQLYERLTESEHKYRTIFDLAGDALFVHDLDGRYLDVNQEACERLGYTREEHLSMTPADVSRNRDLGEIRDAVDSIVRVGSAAFETIHVTKDGREIPTSVNSTVIAYGEIQAVLSVARDITETKRLQSELERMAVTDALTGSYNRRFFLERAGNEVDRAERYSEPVSLAVLDIDNFKNTNDTYGHEMGDLVLQKLVTTVGSSLRRTDLFARYGGEEFAILLIETALPDAVSMLDRLRQDLSATKVATESHRISFTVSIGVAEYRHGDTLNKLIVRADDQLYRAKRNGKNRVCYQEEDIDVGSV